LPAAPLGRARLGYAAEEPLVRLGVAVISPEGRDRTLEQSAISRRLGAVIADSNRDVTERRQTRREQAALRRVSTLVAHGVQPEELFAVVAEEVGRVADAPSVAVARFESDATATVCGTFPPQGPLFHTGTRVSLEGADVLGLLREHAQPARVDNYAQLEGAIADVIRRSGMRSSVGVPIVVAGRVWGAIVASNTERLPENTAARLAEFTELLAAAIANAEAREALARLADEQAALRRVATLAAQDASPAEIFATVSAEVDRVFGLDPATRCCRRRPVRARPGARGRRSLEEHRSRTARITLAARRALRTDPRFSHGTLGPHSRR
jgi:hypothetical protein